MNRNKKCVLREFRIKTMEFIPKFNNKTYMVDENKFIYFKRYVRKGVTTWQCCSSKICSGRILSRFNQYFKLNSAHSECCSVNINKIEDQKFRATIFNLCVDPDTPRTYVDIYNLASRMHPSAANRINKPSIMKTMIRWKYHLTNTVPKTIDDLSHLMTDPMVYHEYGRNTFGNINIFEDAYRFYDKVTTVNFVADDGTAIVSKIISFRSYEVIHYIKGNKVVNLGADGTGNTSPKSHVSYKCRFDSIRQLYVVHAIIHKKVLESQLRLLNIYTLIMNIFSFIQLDFS